MFYQQFAYVRSGDGEIAVWGQSPTLMKHGAITGPEHGIRWELKCGNDLKIQHGLDEFFGSNFGRALAFYRRSLFDEPIFVNAGADDLAKSKKSYLTAAQKKIMRDLRKRIPAEVQATDEAAFGAWENSWFRGGLAVNSNPRFRGMGQEYSSSG